jgi:hypothetical protein
MKHYHHRACMLLLHRRNVVVVVGRPAAVSGGGEKVQWKATAAGDSFGSMARFLLGCYAHARTKA